MSFVAVAVGSSVASIAGGIGGAVISGNAAKGAAQTQADSARDANKLQYDMFQQQEKDQEPWRQAGAQALSQLQDPSFQHDFSMSDYQADPGYQFRLEQGQKALERSAAARGGLQNGGTLKGLNDYAQGMASSEYQNAYNRFTNNQQNRFGRLASVAGLGQAANGQMAQAGQNYANQAGSNITGAGNAAGAAQIAGGNAMGSTLSGLGSGIGNTWMQATMMNKNPWMNMGSSGGGGGLSMPSSTGFAYNSPTFGKMGG